MSTKKDVFLECKSLAGYYPKAMKVKNPTTGIYEGRELKFINGRAAVTKEELEILKDYEKWGTEIGRVGPLGKRATAKMVEVIKSRDPVDAIRQQIAEHSNEARPALLPDEHPESDEELIARLAEEHNEVSQTRRKLDASEGKPKRTKQNSEA